MAGEAVDDITLINRALARVGASPLAALDEDTELAEKVSAVWTDIKETCLALHEWSFGSRTYALARRSDATGNGWRYGFDLPGGVLGGPQAVLRSVTSQDDVLRDYGLEENILFANIVAVWARFRVMPAIAVWPPEFRLAVITAAASHLAVPVAHDQELAATLGRQAFGAPDEMMRGGLIGAAIALDRAKRPVGSPLLAADPLTQARYG